MYSTRTGTPRTAETSSFRVFASQKWGAASGIIAMPRSRQAKGATQKREGTKVDCSIRTGVYLILNWPLHSYRFRTLVYSETRVHPEAAAMKRCFHFSLTAIALAGALSLV